MASNTEAFPMFIENQKYFDRLTDEEFGKVMRRVFATITGKDYEEELTPVAYVVSDLVIDQVQRAQEARERKKESGSKGGRAKAESSKSEEAPSEPVANSSNDIAKVSEKLANSSTSVANSSNDVANSSTALAKPSSNQIESNRIESNQYESNQDDSKSKKGYCGAGPTLPPAGAQDTEAYSSLPEPTRKSGNDDTKGGVCPKDSTSENRHEIIDYLNRRMGTSYKPDSKGIKAILDPRLKDGYTVEDCKTVVDNMIMAWGNDEKMRQYIRPSTLFRPSHIDSYLNYRQTVPRAAQVLIDDEEDDIGKYF